MRIIALSFILAAFVTPLFAGVPAQVKPMIDRMARYEATYTNCDNLDESRSNQLIGILQLNPASDPMSLKMICSALKRVKTLKLVSAKIHIRDLLDVMVDGNVRDLSTIPAQLRDVHYMALSALGALSDSEADAEILSVYLQTRKLDNVGEYLVAKALGEMKPNPRSVKALNDFLTRLPEKSRNLADEAVLFALLDSVEKQNSKSSITPLFMIQTKVSANRELYNRISEVVASLSAGGGK